MAWVKFLSYSSSSKVISRWLQNIIMINGDQMRN